MVVVLGVWCDAGMAEVHDSRLAEVRGGIWVAGQGSQLLTVMELVAGLEVDGGSAALRKIMVRAMMMVIRGGARMCNCWCTMRIGWVAVKMMMVRGLVVGCMVDGRALNCCCSRKCERGCCCGCSHHDAHCSYCGMKFFYVFNLKMSPL